MHVPQLLLRWLAGWGEVERGRFVIWLPLAMAAGVVFYDSLTVEPPAWLGAACGFAALLVAWLVRWPVPRAAAALLAAGALGMGAAEFATWRAPPLVELPRRAVVVAGTVRAVEQLPQGRRVTIGAPSLNGGEAIPRMLRIRLRGDDATPFMAGDAIRVRALLMRPAPPAYPGAWDLQRDAFYQGLGGYGYALNPAVRAGEAGVLPLQALRETVAARVTAALPDVTGAIAATLLTGSTSLIPESDRAAFRDSGLAHLLAIAGLHIGIVMAWSFACIRLGLALSERAALHWPLKTIAAAGALAAGAGYLLLTGGHVPILRSFAMASLATLGMIAGRRALSLRGLAFAMAAIVLGMPNEVLGVSFQMSFSAVLALIAGYEALRPWLSKLHGNGAWWRRLAGHILALGLTSALAGTASAPYGAYHFGHVQLYYVAANMVAVPLTALWVMPAGMLALLAMPLHLEALPLAVMGWGISAVLAVGRSVAAWPMSVMAAPHMPPWGLAVVTLGLAWLGIWRSRMRLLGVPAIMAGLLSPLTYAPPDMLLAADGRLLGIRLPEAVFLQANGGVSRFTRAAWLELWGASSASNLSAPPFDCGEGACAIAINGSRVLILQGGTRCDGDLLVSLEPIRQSCPDRPPRIDRFSVWRENAHAVWLTPGHVRILSDRAYRGDRPWVIPLPTSTRVPEGLAVAPAEELPPE